MSDHSLSQFVTAATEIRQSGRWAALNENIISLANDPGVGNEWQVQLLGALCFQVFSEYMRLTEAYSSDQADPALLAWRARNLLELSVWAAYFALNRNNARRLYEDAGRDVKNVLDVFERWGREAVEPVDWLAALAEDKDELSRRAAREGIDSLDGSYMRIERAAAECGLKDMFTTMNKLLSKFAHPTAMQILGMADDDKQSRQLEMFHALGCCFFAGAFGSLESCVPYMRHPPGQ